MMGWWSAMSRPRRTQVDTTGLEHAVSAVSDKVETSLGALETGISGLKPSWWQEARDWFAALSTFVAFAALGVSWYSLDQTIELAKDDNQQTRYQALSDRLLESDSVFVDKPELVPYFFGGEVVSPIADADLQQLVEAVAVRRVDTDEYIFTNLLDMAEIVPSDHRFVLRTPEGPPDVRDDWLAWSEAITGHFRDSPAMCAVVFDPEAKEVNRAYGAAFVTALADAEVCPGLVGYDNY